MSPHINYLFYLKAPKKSNSKPTLPEIPASPIYLRITVEGLRTELSTGETTLPGLWNQAKVRIKGTGESSRIANLKMDELLAKAKEIAVNLYSRNKPVSGQAIKNKMLGIGAEYQTLVEGFRNS